MHLDSLYNCVPQMLEAAAQVLLDSGAGLCFQLTSGTARTANLNTSWPLMTILENDPSAEAPVLFNGFSPSWLK